MNGQLNSLESFDSGSNYKFGDKMIKTNAPRSLFDLSHLNTLTIPNAGMMVPIACWETLPSDDFDINVDCLLRVMPQVVPLYSRQRLYVYAFYSRYSDLWNNWQVFMDKGYTGNVNYTIPTLINDTGVNVNILYDSNATIQPDTLADYFGLPIGASCDNLFSTASSNPTAKISAMKSMMLLRIYRDYFMNKNHWINDRVMLPDDDSRFRLNNDGQLMSALDENKNFYFCLNGYSTYDKYDLTVSGNNYYFTGIKHDYPDDYFVSAIPFPQRGTAPELTKTINTSLLGLDFSAAVAPGTISTDHNKELVGVDTTGKVLYLPVRSSSGTTNLQVDATGLDYQGIITGSASKNSAITSALNKGKVTGNNIGISIAYDEIIKLALEQQELIQLARTDGSYFQFGISFFGEPSKAAYDFKPLYIGGTYKNIAFTEVLQTATTQTTVGGNTVDNPAGAYVGHGITGISSGRIGHCHCDDYGMIMMLACIMPDVYYSQGLDRIDTDSVQGEKFMPERVLLGMQPILNKEIYYAGNNGDTQGDDNYLWAYQNPFDWYRYLPNRIHGKIANPSSKSFYPFTQARHFSQLPNWGRAFSSTGDVRKDYLTAPTEDAYSAQFSINIRAVRPLPYKAIPAKLVHF